MFGYLATYTSAVIEHHLRKDYSVEWFAILQCEEYGSDAVLTE